MSISVSSTTNHISVRGAALNGSSFGTTTCEEIEIAKLVAKRVPSIDLLRFVNSGTEAVMSAIRLARGYTGKDKIVKFDGGYHGHFDDLLANAGSGVADLVSSSSKGVPVSHVANTLSLPYNDTKILEKTLKKYRNKIACVVLEPVAGNMGVIPAKNVFLKTLRRLTKQLGIVLIFDEVMTGFRSTKGSVQAETGIIPDMTCLGKIIGGGFPVGAYGGRKDIMECLAPLGDVYQAGTFSGNPLVMKTGLTVLELLDKDFYKNLNCKCKDFVENMNEYFRKKRYRSAFFCLLFQY